MYIKFRHIIILIVFNLFGLVLLGQTSHNNFSKIQKEIIDTPRVKSRVYEGIVLNEKGEGLDHVKGYIMDSDGMYFLTDNNGYFKLITHNTKDKAEIKLVKKGFESKKIILTQNKKSNIFLYPEKTPENNMLFSGFVLDENNRGISKAKIFLKDNPKIFTESDENGRFKMFVPINKGKIHFIVKKRGFEAHKSFLQQKDRQNKLVHLKKEKKYNPLLRENRNLRGTLYTEKEEPIPNLVFQLNGKEYKSNENGQFEILDDIKKDEIKFKFKDNFTLIRWFPTNDYKYIYVYLREIRSNLNVEVIKPDSAKTIIDPKLIAENEELSTLIDELKEKNEKHIKENKKLHQKIALLNKKLQNSSNLSSLEKDSLKNYILSLENIIASNEEEYQTLYRSTKAKIREMKFKLFKKDSLYLQTKKDYENEQKAKNDIKNDYYNSIIRFSVIILGSLVLVYLFFLMRKRYQNQHKRLAEHQSIIDKQEEEILLQKEDIEKLKQELKKHLKNKV